MLTFEQKILLEKLFRAAQEGCGVNKKDLLGKCRSRHLARTRQAMMCIVYENTELSMPEVGRIFNRDHTTVLHALKMKHNLVPWWETISHYYRNEHVRNLKFTL